MIRQGKPEWVRLTGCLEEINGCGEVTGRLREPDGASWLCRFPRSDMPRLARAWMREVQVSGRRSVGGEPQIVEVEQLEIRRLDRGSPASQGGREEWNLGPPFDESPSLEVLAREQGVRPIGDIDALSDLWPRDDDPDELLAFIIDDGRSL